MMWNLLVFALIGLLTGAAARVLFAGRQPVSVLGTLALGTAGGMVGGAISWLYWPEVDGLFHTGNLAVSALGASAAILFWAGVAYARWVSASRASSR